MQPGDVRNLPQGMTRAEISALLEPATFKPFVLVTHAGRFRVPHPDFIYIPPHDAEEPEPSFIVVYTKTGDSEPKRRQGFFGSVARRSETEDTDG